MAAPIGNNNASKSKPWADAIRRAIARHDANAPEDLHFLNKLADQLLVDCLNKEKDARDELTNRLDGKVAQSVTVAGDDEKPMVHKVVWEVVKPSD